MEDTSGAYQSYLFTGTEEEITAQIRATLGDEAAEEHLRTEQLRRHPRSLNADERAALDAALAPILADLRSTGVIVPDVRYEAWYDHGPDYVYAFIGPPGNTVGNRGVWINRAESPAQQVARLAEEVQEWELEELWAAGRGATWPQCPDHPGTHPLEAVAEDGMAVWRCLNTQRVVSVIGQLGRLPGQLDRFSRKPGSGELLKSGD